MRLSLSAGDRPRRTPSGVADGEPRWYPPSVICAGSVNFNRLLREKSALLRTEFAEGDEDSACHCVAVGGDRCFPRTTHHGQTHKGLNATKAKAVFIQRIRRW